MSIPADLQTVLVRPRIPAPLGSIVARNAPICDYAKILATFKERRRYTMAEFAKQCQSFS